MAGPWEAYQEQGPWTKFAAPEKPSGGLLRNFAAGTMEALSGNLAALSDPGAGDELGALGLQPKVPMGNPAQGQHALNVGLGKAGLNPETVPADTWLEKLTRSGGNFAAAAAAPGSIPLRVARVAIPATTSEIGGQVAGTPGRIAGALVGGGLTEAGPSVLSTGAKVLNRGWSAAGGKEFLDPNAIARDYVTRAVNRDGGVPTLRQRLQDWQQSGASNPALIDVTGNNTRRLVRSAASGQSGEAQNIAQDYQNGVAANLQDRTADLARGLTPGEQRSADAVTASLKETRGKLATEQYAAPYAEPAAVTKDMVSALQGPEGRAAIGRAYLAARANRNTQQMGELKDLLGVAGEQSGGLDPLTGKRRTLQTALSEVSAGSLDRVRMAMRNIGGRFAATNANDIASGYAGRTASIDTALDQTPGLQEARGNYRNISQQMDAIPVGQAATRTPAQLYAEQLKVMSPESRKAAGIGYRDSLVAGIEQPTAGGTGFLNRVANSNQQTSNLANQFGPEAGGRFQAGVGNEVSRVQNARFISPNTGSQTALRSEEAGLIDAIPTTHLGVLTRAVGALRNGLTLTDTQRADIVRLGVSEADIRGMAGQMPRARADDVARQILIAGQLSNRRQ